MNRVRIKSLKTKTIGNYLDKSRNCEAVVQVNGHKVFEQFKSNEIRKDELGLYLYPLIQNLKSTRVNPHPLFQALTDLLFTQDIPFLAAKEGISKIIIYAKEVPEGYNEVIKRHLFD